MNHYSGLRIKLRTVLVFLVLFSLTAVMCIVRETSIMFSITLFIWLLLFSITVTDIQNNPALFCFLISFFVFLLGRQFCYEFFNENELYSFLNSTNNYTYFNVILSLLAIFLGNYIGKGRIVFSNRKKQPSFLESEYYGPNYQLACKIVYYICALFSYLYVFLRIAFVKNVGYLASYTEESGGSGIPSIISWIKNYTPVILSFYLATKPPKRKLLFPVLIYEIYGILTVFTGQRYPFIGISMFFLVYWIIRNKDEEWVKWYHYLLLIIAIPVLMLFTTAYDSIRIGETFRFSSFLSTIEKFFIDQGGSINTIRRTIYNASDLKDMKLVSFSGIYSILFENPIAHRLFNITVYDGNSIDHALYGHSLAHRLSYIAYGSAYLSGRGTGTSYIAELLHDFGPIGVFLGSLIYGDLLGKISVISFTDKFKDGILLATVYFLMLAPRAEFDSFISGIFSLQSIVFFIMTLLLSRLLLHNNTVRSRYENKISV